MTGHLEFREGRRLRASDLNGESVSREADDLRHLEHAHPSAPEPRLIGTTVTHPRGSPSMALTPGGQTAGVRIALRGAAPALELGVSGAHRAFGPVTGDRSDVRITGPLRVVSQATPATTSMPWSIRALDVRGDDGALVGQELRVELSAPPGSPPQESRVAVGTVDARGFLSVFAVDAAGTVTIDGDLEVAGSVSQGQIPPDPEDPRFLERLGDVVARRVVGAALTSPDTVLALSVTADDSSDDETTLDISITPRLTLNRWGAAMEIQRGGSSSFRLVGVGGPSVAATKVVIETAAVPWDPPLTSASTGRVVVAVVAFDAQGTVHAQRFTTSPLTG